MPAFVTLIGYPGVGKSTYALRLKEEGYTVISADDAWKKIASQYHMESADDAYREHRTEIFIEMLRNMTAALARGDDIVFDALNLSRVDRGRALKVAKESPLEYTLKALVIHPPEADVHAQRLVRRVLHERRLIAADGFYQSKLAEKFEMPTQDEGFHCIEVIGTPPKEPLMSM